MSGPVADQTPEPSPVTTDPTGWRMWDAHMECAGFLASPSEGEVYTPVLRALAASAANGVEGCRMFGVSAEYLHRLRLPDRPGLSLVPVGSYLDGEAAGFRSTRLCREPAAVERSLAAFRADGLDWVTLGADLPPGLARLATDLARDAGLRVAAEGPAAAPDQPPDSIEGLLDLVAGQVPDRPRWRRLADLATADPELLAARLDPWIAAGVPVVPLLLRLRRACVLEDAVNAEGLELLAQILPYHRYLVEMRNPAAMRFGRKHVVRHLGYPRLDREDRRELSAGWDVLTGLLVRFAGAGGRLAGGSGAPSLGMAPGPGLYEEARLWLGAGVPPAVVRTAFCETARDLAGRGRVEVADG